MVLAPSDTWRIRAGAGDFKDHSGWAGLWRIRRSYTGDTAETGVAIDAKEDPELYETERWGPDFSYVLPVPPGPLPGEAQVRGNLRTQPGQRVFDAVINGKKALDDFDILREAKGFGKGIDENLAYSCRTAGDGLKSGSFLKSKTRRFAPSRWLSKRMFPKGLALGALFGPRRGSPLGL